MNKWTYLNILSAVFIVLHMFVVHAAAPTTIKTINIPIETEIEILEVYKNLLIKAYSALGYKINFHKVSTGRGLIEVNSGRFDALIIRIDIRDDDLDNLIRVPIILATGNIVLYCQLNMTCDPSVFEESSNFIGVLSGSSYSSLFMKNKPASSYQVINNKIMAEMFTKGRLNYILALEDDIFGQVLTIENNTYQNIVIQKVYGYHFVHNKLANIVPELTLALTNAMKD